MLQIVFCHKHLKYLPMHPFIFSVNKKVFLKCKVFIQPYFRISQMMLQWCVHWWVFLALTCTDGVWHTKPENLFFFFLCLILVRSLLALSRSVSQFLESCKELGKDPRRNNKKSLKRMEEKTSEERLKTLNWPHLKTAGQGLI